MQTTFKRDVSLVGMGLHSGRPARLVLRPATQGGIRFRRTDVTDRDNIIPARYDRVTDTTLCTLLSNEAGVSVSTVEHLMSALAGTGVTHALIDIDGPEVPIMDGSALRFAHAILKAGLRRLDGAARAIRVLKPVVLEEKGGVVAELRPASALSIDFEIDFADAAISRQSRSLSMVNGAFLRELADCRTFCRRADVEAMQARGLALGGSLDNAIVVDGDRILNPGGLRRADEFVRHKMLDALGDLALAGAPILGAYRGVRAGHGVTNRLLRKMFATEGAWEEVMLGEAEAGSLPGAGVDLGDLARAG
ncbi:UDP-3-O-acyl-N-acetylglucosamine deacetylase [Amaricoccus solimangrovi]|uniref:UDP-3-O-acyl-N-acetylglucosamine deacetylase n=1 Tax=Amaricoccus solimangrovi TaxID=2589815 RepID=A0A501WT30_9RHOB|nr:UDP-3-O-acyl-N-acetylglucosamine deacetylase [Amaricoccus solimangrovi]TPE50171.1 UDP-3-O-acyl-N-acetylglucosamine deacetylase [Amaricoccus solimangrovi]